VKQKAFDLCLWDDTKVQHQESFVAAIKAAAYGAASPERRAFVLVNPHAGPGGADKIWEKQVRPIFEAAHWTMNVVRTTHGGQARELVRQLDINKFDVIVPCSGDGLPHEVFNGLGDRADARAALAQLPVAHIPCGSGNALSLNLNGTHRPSLAALAIVKGVVKPMDLVSVTQQVKNPETGVKETKRTLSFLSQALGFIATLDLGTEHLRFLGDGRFTYGAIKGTVIFKPIYPVSLAVQVELEKDQVKAHYRSFREPGFSKAEQASLLRTHKAQGGEGSSSLVDESVVSTPATEEAQSQASDAGLPRLRYGTVADKLPHGWEMVDHEKMGMFYAGNVSSLCTFTFSSLLTRSSYRWAIWRPI
jgi:sphingosine kinase